MSIDTTRGKWMSILHWIIALLIAAICVDVIIIVYSLRQQILSIRIAGFLMLSDGLPFIAALYTSLFPGGLSFITYAGLVILVVHFFSILLVSGFNLCRLAALHVLATFFFGAHLFLLVNAP